MKQIIKYLTDEYGEPLNDESLNLNSRSDEIDTIKESKQMREIISELKQLIRKNNLNSLAAPEIGYNKRIFCINFSDNEIKTFINPIITKSEGLVLSEETSNILEDKYLIPRNNKIFTMYTNPMNKIESREISGAASALFQQNINLLDGIILSDIGLILTEDYFKATQEEKNELINIYLDSLDIKQKSIEKLVNEDQDTKQIKDAIEFMTKAEKGEIEFDKPED